MSTGLVFVPARGGSKGIPRKNMAPICGKPLIGYTLDVCRQLKENFATLVSTDDGEIAVYCTKQGFPTAYRRPAELSTDKAHPVDAVLDGVKWYESENKCVVDTVVLLQPTSPIRSVSDINAAVKCFSSQRLESLVGLVSMREHPYECIEVDDASGNWKYLKTPDKLNMQRQEYPNRFGFIDGSIYIFSMNFIKKHKEFNLVKKGVLGQKGDIIVDSVDKPQKIIGISGDNGSLLNTNYKKLNFLNKKILKNEK